MKVALAPNSINMIENPNIKDKRFKIVFNDIPEFSKSLTDIPEIYEIYAGIRGNTQGERKDKKPAIKDVKILTSIKF